MEDQLVEIPALEWICVASIADLAVIASVLYIGWWLYRYMHEEF